MTVIRVSTHSDRVATKYRRLAMWPIALLAAWLSALLLVSIINAVVSALSGHKTEWEQLHGIPIGRLALLGAAVAIAFAHRRIRAAADAIAKPIFPRPARSEWPSYARGLGVAYAMVGAASFILAWTAVSLIAYNILELWADGPPLSDLVLIVPIAAVSPPVLIWAYHLGRNERLRQLQSAIPPALQRAHQLRDHAQALEVAMQEATLLADELQETIDAEKRLVADLLAESTEARRIVEIESDQLTALLAHQERRQRRSTRRERWINIAVAAISLILGYLLNLANPGFLTSLFHH
ncbi:hypothetical protein ACIA49_28185 [Kribbella sp. NPDC051587]|uniref:hypothetical protein n=1 Tax=Kribbella sp. NPDC051587 TaxID=3364119 RepID=UPI00378C3A16